MYSRIKHIRASAGLTQAQFAERISLSRNYVAMIEIGQREPSDRTISDICREFGVDRIWLETGVGEPFVPMDTREELRQIFADILSGRPGEKAAFIEAVAQLPEEVFPVLVKSWIEAAEQMKKTLESP